MKLMMMTVNWVRCLMLPLAAATLALSAPALAERLPPVKTLQSAGDLQVEIVDMTPRFLAFYREAAKVDDADARFALWKEKYGFAAVPPGPAGEQMARELLDGAWTKYPASLSRLQQGAKSFGNEPIETLSAVVRLLGADRPLAIRLVTYVGAFDDNAFAARVQGVPVVHFPVEMPAERRRLLLPHEITHAVHMHLAGLSGGWERSVAATLIQEGLAMHVARELNPGKPDAVYIEHEPGWWSAARGKQQDILKGLLPALAAKDSDTVFRFTVGKGPAGLNREAYAAGWWVIEQLRSEGMTLAEIARVPEENMPGLADKAISAMLER
ncbi:hypothetical protein [Sphingomonas xanthus]|uniref:DUF2268 domain-containing protein n=1 Tax=Sphingomonas xanthus TaxID=2594473 RepID=A0A516INR8_9SPHN|nr:hypothetical protein [Sphingomonas xanthus]QDP18560.1 hypothetical protein FMM02_00435 [Sphingomonas xanthus]